MIITQTPYRIGLAGGGTDLPSYYRDHGGAVVNVAMDKHFYVSVCPRFDGGIRVAYSQTEIADTAGHVEHDLVRAALTNLAIDDALEIAMTGEVPAGTGLGSSSAVAVGLLNALTAARGTPLEEVALADLACTLELDWLGRAMGRQDQYGCAIGGYKLLEFSGESEVRVTRLDVAPRIRDALARHALLLYVGRRASNSDVLGQQISQTDRNAAALHRMKALAYEMADTLTGDGDVRAVAEQLREGWFLKRDLSRLVSTGAVDDLYEAARARGAWGGKLLGAGKAGFLLLLAPPECHAGLRALLPTPGQARPFGISDSGTRVVFRKRVPFIGGPRDA